MSKKQEQDPDEKEHHEQGDSYVREVEQVEHKEIRHTTILGRSGSGKTTFALKLIKEHVREYDLIVFINTQHELIVDKLSPYHAYSVDELDALIEEGRRVIIYKIPIPETEEEEEQLDEEQEIEELMRYLWITKKINEQQKFMIVIDEADMFASKSYIPKIYKNLLTKGRRYKLTIVNISQRPQLLHNTILTQTRTFYIFKLNSWDYKYMLKMFDYENPKENYRWVKIEN